MGFRSGTYATVWEVQPISQAVTKVRLSTSYKDKQTGMYSTDFSGYTSFVGAATAQKALNLRERDKIKLGDVEVRTKYDKEKKTTYYNFTVFSFDVSDFSGRQAQQQASFQNGNYQQETHVDDGDIDDSGLPF